MEQKYNIVALVPLRGGSKSIPFKNIKTIAGKPLCLWVVEAACNSKLINKAYASTDSKKIRDVIVDSALPVEIVDRDRELASDTASTESVMIDFMQRFDFDILVTIQATSPLTIAGDFDNAIKYFLDNDFDSLLTGVRIKRFFWSNSNKPINYDPACRPLRQDFDGYIMENGAFYITKRTVLEKMKCRLGGKIGIYEMSPETATEIDEPADWLAVENILVEREKNDLRNIAANIKMLVMDVDGVLTDSYIYLDNNGIEMKRFSVRDGMGIGIIRDMGIKTAVITKEKTDIIDFRAGKLKIDYIYKGVDKKIKALYELSEKSLIPLENIAYIGDDLNDLEVIKAAGFSAAPANAEIAIKNAVDYICKKNGGSGCIREICDIITESCKNIGNACS